MHSATTSLDGGVNASGVDLQVADGMRGHAVQLARVLRDLVNGTTCEAMPMTMDGDELGAMYQETVEPLLERSVELMGQLLKESRQLVVLYCDFTEADCQDYEELMRGAGAMKLTEEEKLEVLKALVEWRLMSSGDV
jgi:hypothetical protein